jgi:hypothetical protein
VTKPEIITRWEARRDELRRLKAQVSGAIICDEMLRDLESLFSADENDLLTIKDAAQLSGYSREHLGRLVQEGKIPNAGRPNAPRVRRCDLPIKPGHLPEMQEPRHLTSSSKSQIVRSVVVQGKGTR